MRTSRPCTICHHWFQPHPRVGARQTTCPRPECQRERHRRACAQWHRRNAAIEREGGLRERLTARPGGASADPTATLDWAAIERQLGLRLTVILRTALQHLAARLRDEMRAQPLESPADSGRHP